MHVASRRLALLTAALAGGACSDAARTTTAPEGDAALAHTQTHGGVHAGAAGVTVYALTADGSILTFSSASPGTVSSSVRVTGISQYDQLVGLDFRPSDLNTADGVDNVGVLYAVASHNPAAGRIYKINPTTGAATFVASLATAATATDPGVPVPISGRSFGVGFNPTVDRLRVHSDAEQNLRINVDNGVTIVDPALAYRSDDRHAGSDPSVVGTAYTNSDADPATGTDLYAIDAARDVLVNFPAPGGANSGQMATVGALGVDTDAAVGFDIVGSAGGTAYATLRTSGAQAALYSIDLPTGRATRLDGLAQTGSPIVSITVAP